MKLLAACFLALALILRAAPICATPSRVEAVAAMPGCDEVPVHHGEQPGHKGHDAARACDTCAFPRVAENQLSQPRFVIEAMRRSDIVLLKGDALKPPTPPPRAAVRSTHPHSIGVRS